jgi:lipid-A-disaccharide synthase
VAVPDATTAALAQVPTVVVYRLSWLSWIVGRLLVRLPFVSLVNLLAGRRLVPELLQRDCNGARIAESTAALLGPGEARDAQLEGMRRIRATLAPAGAPGAARRAAQEIAALLGEAW